MAQARLSKYDVSAMSFEQVELTKRLLKALNQVGEEPPTNNFRSDKPTIIHEAKIDGKTLTVRTKDGFYGKSQVFLDGNLVASFTSDTSSVSRAVARAVRQSKIDASTFPRFKVTPGKINTPAGVSDDKIVVEADRVIVYGVPLKRFAKPGPLTPGPDEVEELKGVEKEYRIIATALAKCYPILLEGDTGTGKTSILQHLAHLCNVNLVKVVGDPEYGPSLWIGHLHAKNGETYWVDGDLPTAMRGAEGNGQTWLFVDELSRLLPDNASPLMPVLERRGGKLGKLRLADNPDPKTKMVDSHPDLRVVMAMNPFDADFAGTHEVDLALLRRASVRLPMDYPSTETQLKILKAKFPKLDHNILVRVVNVAEKLRADRKARRISFPCSPSELDVWCDLIPDLGFPLAAQVALINKASRDDRPRVESLVEGRG